MSLGTLLLHEVVLVFGCVFPNLQHISPIPCAPCAPSPLCFPISIPCFTPCILSPSLLALCGLIPIFSTASAIRAIPTFPVSLPNIPKAVLSRLQPCCHHIPIPALPTDLGLSHLHVLGNVAVRFALPLTPGVASWLCVPFGIPAALEGRSRAKVRAGTGIKSSSGSCQVFGAVGASWSLPMAEAWNEKSFIFQPRPVHDSMIP